MNCNKCTFFTSSYPEIIGYTCWYPEDNIIVISNPNSTNSYPIFNDFCFTYKDAEKMIEELKLNPPNCFSKEFVTGCKYTIEDPAVFYGRAGLIKKQIHINVKTYL